MRKSWAFEIIKGVKLNRKGKVLLHSKDTQKEHLKIAKDFSVIIGTNFPLVSSIIK